MGGKPRLKPRPAPGPTYRLRAEIEMEDTGPFIKVPLAAAKKLGKEGEWGIPVRAVVNGMPFYAQLYGYGEQNPFEPFDPVPILYYKMHIYATMIRKIPLRFVGDEIRVVFSYEEHEQRRRGAKILDKWFEAE